MELGIEALLFARADAHKMALLSWRGKRTPGNPRGALHTKAQSLGVTASCADHPHRPKQEPKASILLHHASQIASTRIQWLCRPPQCALCPPLVLFSRSLPQCASLLSPMPLKMCQPDLPLDHAYILPSGAWPARMKPGKAGLPPAWHVCLF